MLHFSVSPRGKKKLCKYELIKSTDQWEWIRLWKGTNEFIRVVVIDVLLYLNLAAILKFFVSVSVSLQLIEQAMYNQIGEVLLTVPPTSPFKIFYVCSTNKYSRFSKPSVHCTVPIAHSKHICTGYYWLLTLQHHYNQSTKLAGVERKRKRIFSRWRPISETKERRSPQCRLKNRAFSIFLTPLISHYHYL